MEKQPGEMVFLLPNGSEVKVFKMTPHPPRFETKWDFTIEHTDGSLESFFYTPAAIAEEVPEEQPAADVNSYRLQAIAIFQRDMENK